MSTLNNPVEILKLLNKSNCGECNEMTCLAFAAAVFKGRRRLQDCPCLDKDTLERFGGHTEEEMHIEMDLEQTGLQLKKRIAAIDLGSAAERVGGRFSDGLLTLKVLGKNFHVDSKGNLSSDVHLHRWVIIPILSYIAGSAGLPVSGEWVAFRELRSGKIWNQFFNHRCEKPLKRVADTYPDLFEDMLHIFSGKQVENHYASDISLVLHPLPKVPILICYWKPEDGLESNLTIFFDSTAEDNLKIESIYMLATGLVMMFEKIALTHTRRG
jgi:hypothetical protein